MRLLTVLLFAVFAVSAQADVADKVMVKKKERKMVLMQDGKVIRSYSVSLGPNPVGHKQQQGDGRTPEGKYRLDYRNANSKFYKSMHVSYPAAADTKSAKARGVQPGGMIMVHGSPNQYGWAGAPLKFVDWTDGCIAVTNEEMDEIWKMVKDGTEIVIEP